MPGPRPTAFPESGLADQARLYLLDVETEGLSPKTIRDYRSTLRRLCEASPGKSLSDYEGADGTRLLYDFLRGERPTVRNQKAKHLRSFFKWAEDFDYITRNPTRRLKMPRTPSRRRTPQSVERIQTVIDAQPRLNWRLAIMLGAMLGQRRGSVRGIQFKHFDLVATRVTITLKGGRVVKNPIPYKEIVLAVEQLVQDGVEPDHFLLYPIRRNNLPGRKSDWIEEPTKPLSDSAFSRWWKECIERAGDVPYFDFHTLRVSAGTRLYLHTHNLLATSRALNHAKVETTSAHYIEVDELSIVDAFQRAGWS